MRRARGDEGEDKEAAPHDDNIFARVARCVEEREYGGGKGGGRYSLSPMNTIHKVVPNNHSPVLISVTAFEGTFVELSVVAPIVR